MSLEGKIIRVSHSFFASCENIYFNQFAPFEENNQEDIINVSQLNALFTIVFSYLVLTIVFYCKKIDEKKIHQKLKDFHLIVDLQIKEISRLNIEHSNIKSSLESIQKKESREHLAITNDITLMSETSLLRKKAKFDHTVSFEDTFINEVHDIGSVLGDVSSHEWPIGQEVFDLEWGEDHLFSFRFSKTATYIKDAKLHKVLIVCKRKKLKGKISIVEISIGRSPGFVEFSIIKEKTFL